MRRILLLLTCAATLFVSGCGNDSSLPEATGKSSIRAINAVPSSQEINFLIEERLLDSVPYQGGSNMAQWDDLEYTFNFDVFYAGDTAVRRVASEFLDVEANKNYTFLISGNLAGPTITVWQDDDRSFDEADTVFAAKFAHASPSFGALDYYFTEPTVAPAPGNQVATLSFGEVSAAADYAEGDFVLTITTAGDVNDVVYRSGTNTFAARDTYLISSFDGDISDTAPVFARAHSDLGATFAMPDVNYPPTVQFVHASMDLGASDIFDDEMLTSLRVANHDFLDASTHLDIVAGANTFYYTPAGDTSVVSIETALSAFGGLRYRFVATGLAGNLNSLAFLPDVRPVETQVKILPYHASNNVEFLDLYAVEPDGSIDEVGPIRTALVAGLASTSGALPAGSFDLYVTEFGQKVVLAGPYRINVALGDVVDMIIVDTIDPAVLDVFFLSGGPTP